MENAQSDEKINVPVGSERVVSVRRLSKSSVGPLTVDTQINDPDVEVHQTKTHVQRRHRSDHHRYSYRTNHQSTSGRKSTKHRSRSTKAWSTVIPSEQREGKRVLSCLEMSVNDRAEVVDGDPVANPEVSKRSKAHKKNRSGELGSWLSLKSEPHLDQSSWRYSNIFAPESPKVRPHKSRTSKTRSVSALPPTGSQIWSPFIPVPVSYFPSFPYMACPKCGEHPTVQMRQNSNENFAMAPPSPAYVPVLSYQPYPPDPQMMYGQMRSASMVQPPSAHAHHHHHHNLPPTGRGGVPRSRTMPPTAAAGGRNYSQSTVISTSADDVAFPDNEDYDRMIMEIEYAVADDEDPSNRMTPQTLQFILKVAKHSCKLVDLEQMAKHVKLILDKKFGEKWQVVVGDDSYGSYLASLPGALANFRINDLVFLIWQT